MSRRHPAASSSAMVMPHVVRAWVAMKTMPMVAVMVEAAAAQTKRGHGGYENEFDDILLHNFFSVIV